MRLGIDMPSAHPDRRPFTTTEVMARARAIEAAGFDSIWLGENIGRGWISPDPLAMLLVAAAATDHIEVGSAIIEVPLRNPAELALRLLTMHALTGGRFVAGLGAGSTKADFDACGVDFSQRFRMLSTALPIIRGLCKGEQVGEANLHPWPSAVGGPPLLIGAWASGIWVRKAAREYDGWLASGRAGNQFKTLSEGMRVYRDNGGKRAIIATVGVDLHAPTTLLTADEPFNLRCAPDEAASRLQQLAGLGFDDVHLVMRQKQTVEDLPAIRALMKKE